MKMDADSDPLFLRKQIWLALSEFYVDRELTETELDGIADTFLRSGLSLAELKHIDLLEVFPVLQPNLLSVAGVWQGFKSEWLFDECGKRYKKRYNSLHRLRYKIWNKLFFWMRRAYWVAIEKRMQSAGLQ